MLSPQEAETKATEKVHAPQEVVVPYQTRKVQIKATENGPDLVVLDGKVSFALCRCGGSANKPYCDDTHATIGFKAAASEIKVL